MLSLIRTEFIKIKRRKKILGSALAFVLSSFILVGLIYSPESNQIGLGIIDIIIAVPSLIVNIFLCVMTGEIFMDEYRNKTINVMFTYPISRTKIYFSKLAVLSVYSLILSAAGTAWYMIFAFICNIIKPGFTNSITPSIAPYIILLIFASAIVNIMFSIVYSFFAAIMKSVGMMVVSCVIFANISAKWSVAGSPIYIYISLGIGFLCLFALIPIINIINKKDVLA